MITLFIGGVKSGKSRLAEAYILAHSAQKPVYLATAECIDEEMAERINDHQQRRRERFLMSISIENFPPVSVEKFPQG